MLPNKRCAQVLSEAMLRADADAERANKAASKTAGNKASTAAAPPPPPPVSDWDAYVATASSNVGVANRLESPEVVADQLRQYEAAVAAAAAVNMPVDPAWQAWVARVPDHHKQ